MVGHIEERVAVAEKTLDRSLPSFWLVLAILGLIVLVVGWYQLFAG